MSLKTFTDYIPVKALTLAQARAALDLRTEHFVSLVSFFLMCSQSSWKPCHRIGFHQDRLLACITGCSSVFDFPKHPTNWALLLTVKGVKKLTRAMVLITWHHRLPAIQGCLYSLVCFFDFLYDGSELEFRSMCLSIVFFPSTFRFSGKLIHASSRPAVCGTALQDFFPWSLTHTRILSIGLLSSPGSRPFTCEDCVCY